MVVKRTNHQPRRDPRRLLFQRLQHPLEHEQRRAQQGLRWPPHLLQIVAHQLPARARRIIRMHANRPAQFRPAGTRTRVGVGLDTQPDGRRLGMATKEYAIAGCLGEHPTRQIASALHVITEHGRISRMSIIPV